MVIGLDVHKRSVYGTVMEDNGTIIVQRNMENNMETVNGFLSVYKDHDIVIESSTSGKYLSKELSILGYEIHLINPAKVPEIANNYKKTDKEDSFQLADVFRKGGMKEIYIPSAEIENIRLVMDSLNLYTAAGILSEIGTINRFDNKLKFALYTGLIPSEYSSGERTIKGHITKHGPSLLRFFLVETAHSLIKFTKKFKSKYLSIVRRLGKKRSIIAIARILAETIYAMLKNNTRYIEKERKETINPDELYFKRLEELSLKKINNMNKLASNVKVHGDSANLIYRGGIKDC